MAEGSRAEWRALLGKHFLLQHLDESELDELLAFAHTRRLAANEVVFQKGDPGDNLLGIIHGRVKISTLSAEGREVVLNIMAPGELFGEIAVIDGKARTADAVAMAPSELVVISRRDLMPFLEKRPELATRLLVVLCERIRWVSDQYEDAVFLNLPARLAKHLLRLADRFGVETEDGVRIELKLSQEELGKLMGISRESINKTLRGWESEGLIKARRGILTLVDNETLDMISQSL